MNLSGVAVRSLCRAVAGLLLCVGLFLPSVAAAQPAGRSTAPAAAPQRDLEAEALDLIVEISAAASDDRRIAAVRKLADYKYDSVAAALVQLLEEAGHSAIVDREVEWALAALSALALQPLAESLSVGTISTDAAVVVLTRIARQDPAIVAPCSNTPRRQW